MRSVKARSFNICTAGKQGITDYAAEGSAYGYYTYSYLPAGKITSVFDVNGTNPVTATETYAYDNPLHKQVTRAYTTDSRGNTLATINVYPQDYALNTRTPDFIARMVAINNVGMPVEKVQIRANPADPRTFNVIAGAITEYPDSTGDYPSKSYSLDVQQPLVLGTAANSGSFVLSNGASIPLSAGQSYTLPAGAYTRDAHYRQEAAYDYDHEKLKDFRIYTGSDTAGLNTVFLWDVNRIGAVAQVKNARFQQVAFTDFEEQETYGAPRASNPDNWNIPAKIITDSVAMTGHYSGNLTGSTISTVDAIPAGTYTLAYWSKAGPLTTSVRSGLVLGGLPVNGWTYYQHTIQLPAPALLSVKGNAKNQFIDGLRLYPQGALMTTYTYDPLVGMTSSADTKGEPTFYRYDDLQRLTDISDQYGNVIKSYCYAYAGQVSGCKVVQPAPTIYYSAPAHGDFQRDNCDSSYTGSTVRYVLEFGAFTSVISQQDADLQAGNYIQQHGQAYADSIGTCTIVPVQEINYSLVNNTGDDIFLTFQGGSLNIPAVAFANKSTIVQIPQGTYTVTVYTESGNVIRTITLGQRPPVSGTTVTFDNVNVSPGSTELNLQID